MSRQLENYGINILQLHVAWLVANGYKQQAASARRQIRMILKKKNTYCYLKINNSKVLDLFSGTGSFGIECLSRGAKKVIFFENYINSIKIWRLVYSVLVVVSCYHLQTYPIWHLQVRMIEYFRQL